MRQNVTNGSALKFDSIIQKTGIRPDMSNADPFAPFLGGLGAEAYVSSSMNLTALLKRAQVKKLKEWKNNQDSIEEP